MSLMKVYLYLIGLFLSLFCVSQVSVHASDVIDSLKYNARYPNISTASAVTNKAVSKLIRKEVFDRRNQRNQIQEAVWSVIKDSASLDYEVLYNQNGILSLQIQTSTASIDSKYYLNIAIDEKVRILKFKDVLTPHKDLLNRFSFEHVERLTVFQDELKNKALKDTVGKSSLLLSVTYIEKCKVDFLLTEFYLGPKGLTIIDNCEFPEVMKALQPINEITYTYEELQPYLKRPL